MFGHRKSPLLAGGGDHCAYLAVLKQDMPLVETQDMRLVEGQAKCIDERQELCCVES